MGACWVTTRYALAMSLLSCFGCYARLAEAVTRDRKSSHGAFYFGAPDQRLSEADDNLTIDLDAEDSMREADNNNTPEQDG